jgi:hypothetical protein
MTYHWKLATGHQLSIDNEGAQTIVAISFDNGGRQQRTSNSFTTGIWLSPPEITFDPTGAIVTITTTSGESIVKIDGNNIQMRDDVRNDDCSYSQSVSTSSSSTSNVEPLAKPLDARIVPPGNVNVNPNEPVSHRKFCT